MDKYLRYFPHFLIFSYLIRLLAVGAQFGDAIVMLVFGSLYALLTYLEHIREPEANAELKKKVQDLSESHESLKNKVSSVTLANSLRK
jgi:hypothetical protein